MSQRITRSAARRSAASPATDTPQSNELLQQLQTPSSSIPRKRKASDDALQAVSSTEAQPQPRRPKRSRIETLAASAPPSIDSGTTIARSSGRRKHTAAMSSTGSRKDLPGDEPPHALPSSSSSGSRRKQKSRKPVIDTVTPSSSTRRRARGNKLDEDTTMQDQNGSSGSEDGHLNGDDTTHAQDVQHEENDNDSDNPFGGGFLGRHGGSLTMSTLRALTGMISGVSGRLRGILENLQQRDDPSMQLIALQELSEILLVSNEDNLHGHFHPDAFVKEIVPLMQPNSFTGEENPEMMLLACRCLANLMEALPSSTASVVYGGAVPVLCEKLLEINYIDLAEQALSTLEKISVEFPGSIVKEGGLTACLTYLDFFATSTQRTAVTTAANCCRNIAEDSFPVVRDVMPILLNVLSSSDQKVLEQGCLCISRIVESFRNQDDKLEELINEDILKAILGLLLPGTTNVIGPNIHTQFLRVLSTIARASPKRSVELIKMQVVNTLYQILTGVSPPAENEDIAERIDSIVVMQALIHRPREQIYETLNVICELLPNVQGEGLTYIDDLVDLNYPSNPHSPSLISTRGASNVRKVELLKDCRGEVKRFTAILLPTLTDAFSSTVNLNVRQKVLSAQLKMLSNLDTDILEDALRTVPYASYLAAILSQQDHPTLVTYALQAAELLLKRLEPIYRYQFYREGVISEIAKLAMRPCKPVDDNNSTDKDSSTSIADEDNSRDGSQSSHSSSTAEVLDAADVDVEAGDVSDEADDEGLDGEDISDREDSESVSSADGDHEQHQLPSREMLDMDDVITAQAKKFMEAHEDSVASSPKDKAAETLSELKALAQSIEKTYTAKRIQEFDSLFIRLAEYFEDDALESITSYELLTSDVVHTLLKVLCDAHADVGSAARTAFLTAFKIPSTKARTRSSTVLPRSTAFNVLVAKLQDLLSRAEHFDVITVHNNSFDSNRSSGASMLAKQLRLRLNADVDSDIPIHYRSIMVSIQAIATFKSLDDYLRPRLSLADRPRGGPVKSRETMINAMAAYAAAFGGRENEGRRLPIPPPFSTVPGPLDGAKSKHATRSQTTAPPPELLAQETTLPTTPLKGPMQKGSRKKLEKKTDISTSPSLPPPPAEPFLAGDHLECADETRISDDDDSLGEDALDAIVDDLEQEITNAAPEPDAVSMEVAPTGKVTARKPDGTRVATPLAGAPAAKPSSSRLAEAIRPVGTPAINRSMSYAAAVQAVPEDWHLQFFVNDEPVSSEMTIYRAIHFDPSQQGGISSHNLWQAMHTIKYRRVKGPRPEATLTSSQTIDASSKSDMPASVGKNPVASAILRLLSTLHDLDSNVDNLMLKKDSTFLLSAEAASHFVNTKLTAKLNRQLEEPLIVASNCLPSWSEDLARLYPFLFPFETRHLFLQSTSFGYSRSMARWQSAQDETQHSSHRRHRDERPFLGRLQRQKVRISRSRILESAIKVMELYGSSPSVLEVEYFEEVGTGLGPTLEFYSTVSKEFSKKKLKMWRENESNDADEYAFGKNGLFPAPMSEEQSSTENGKKILHLFKILGNFVARSMLDSRIIDVNFSEIFFRIASTSDSNLPTTLGTVSSVDKDLAHSLKVVQRFADAKKRIDEDPKLTAAQKVTAIHGVTVDGVQIEDLALDFTLPGYPSVELTAEGAQVLLTMDNVRQYVDAVTEMTLGKGVSKQIESFKQGFSLVFPYTAMRAFTSEELVMLFGRIEEDWSLETLMDSIKADHGFNLDSRSVRNLLTVMSEFDLPLRRDFLQFVTGSPKLPIGGFKSLTPMFTVVCKPSEAPYTSDDYLPSVMTCVNYLKLPDYSNLEVMRRKLGVAIAEGQGAFHLS